MYLRSFCLKINSYTEGNVAYLDSVSKTPNTSRLKMVLTEDITVNLRKPKIKNLIFIKPLEGRVDDALSTVTFSNKSQVQSSETILVPDDDRTGEDVMFVRSSENAVVGNPNSDIFLYPRLSQIPLLT